MLEEKEDLSKRDPILDKMIYEGTWTFIFNYLKSPLYDFDMLFDFDSEIANYIKYNSACYEGLLRIQRIVDYCDVNNLKVPPRYLNVREHFETRLI